MERHAHVPEDLKPKDELHLPVASPVHRDAMARRLSTDSPQQRYGDRHNPSDPLRRVNRASDVSDRSVEQSPLHRNQVKASGERGVSSEGGHVVGPNTPGRLKTRAGGRGDVVPDKSPTVPKFGEWDDGNPSAGDGYTGKFNDVREEKRTGSAKVPYITDDSANLNNYSHGSNSNKSASFGASAGAKNEEHAKKIMKLVL